MRSNDDGKPINRHSPYELCSGIDGNFVGQNGGGKDVFVHATALARAGLSGLAEGQRVRMQIGQGQKGLEAQTIELLD
jgi:cold shock CspA family protein